MENTNPPANVFNLPPIVLPKMCLEQLLNMLRKRINKSYMPSATGEREFNSKPEYVKFSFPEHPEMPFAHELACTGYFVLTDMWGYSKNDAPVWLHIQIDIFQIMVNLKNDETWIRPLQTPEPLVRWEPRPECTVPINPHILEELLDIYL